MISHKGSHTYIINTMTTIKTIIIIISVQSQKGSIIKITIISINKTHKHTNNTTTTIIHHNQLKTITTTIPILHSSQSSQNPISKDEH